MKIIVIAALLLIIASLGSALYYLYHDRGHGTRMVKALAIRVALSASLLVFLVVSYRLGLDSARRLSLTSRPEATRPRVDPARPRPSCRIASSEPVDEDEQQQPDDVDEVPVPRRGLEREVMARRRSGRVIARPSITDSMIAPIVTWKPWNPVSMKNVEP